MTIDAGHVANSSALGLRGNPFENVLPGAQLDWVDVPSPVLAALSARPFRVELVGEKGAGKSTTLRWLCAQHSDPRDVHARVGEGARAARGGAVPRRGQRVAAGRARSGLP